MHYFTMTAPCHESDACVGSIHTSALMSCCGVDKLTETVLRGFFSCDCTCSILGRFPTRRTERISFCREQQTGSFRSESLSGMQWPSSY